MSSTENPGVESMVERVVDAIYTAIEDTAMDSNCLALQGGRIYFDGDFDAKLVARAAIGAMRNADQAMVDAGVAKDEELEWDHSARAVPQVWEAMCDAALVEKG